MTIHLDPEQEQIVALAIQAGLIHDVDDVVEAGLESIRRRLETRAAPTLEKDADGWLQQLHGWIGGHSHATPLLSDEAVSRDSIYG